MDTTSTLEVWAHRGCSYEWPENTLLSLTAASRLPVTGVELDIQLSADGQMVVIHDESLARTTNGVGNVCDYTFDQIKALRTPAIGEAFVTIPSAREALEALRPACEARGLMVNIELKNGRFAYEGMEQAIVDLVDELHLREHVIYSSFSAHSMGILRSIDPEAYRAVIGRSAAACLAEAREVGAQAIHPFVGGLDLPEGEDPGVDVRVWCVQRQEPLYPSPLVPKPYDTAALLAKGVRGIFTNVPERYVSRR